jgi:ankyrin repeat protein
MTKNTGRELFNACYFGNTNLALKLIRNNAPIDFIDTRDGWSTVHYASRWGLAKVLNELIKRGANINIKTSENETPLHEACSASRKNICIILLKNGANPNIFNCNTLIPSQLTSDDDIKYICDHFSEFIETTEYKNSILKKKDVKLKKY